MAVSRGPLTIARSEAREEIEGRARRSPRQVAEELSKVFGQDFTVQGMLVMTAAHLHEHLGQMIAYARSNNVKPPWAR